MKTPMSFSFLFVTGMLRSGTTLLDKLLSIHPQALVHSQPLTPLYVKVKRAFLQTRRSSLVLASTQLLYPWMT